MRLVDVSTLLEPAERPRVDAAGIGLYSAQHRDTVRELSRDIRERRATAVVVSVARGVREKPGHLAGLIREFPRVPTVALLSGAGAGSAEAVLFLGNCGVRRIVDVREPAGWNTLRNLLARDLAREADRVILARLREDLGAVPPDCWEFFESIFETDRHISSVRLLSTRLGVLPSTLMSRFFRARLPAPKRYLAYARLIRAARLLENPGISVADVANHLEYSSPQSFGRHVKIFLGLNAGRFRREFPESVMVARFRDELVLPHRDRLSSLSPLGMRTAFMHRSPVGLRAIGTMPCTPRPTS